MKTAMSITEKMVIPVTSIVLRGIKTQQHIGITASRI